MPVSVSAAFMIALGLLIAGDAVAAVNSRASVELTSCTLPDLTRPAQCGSLKVPENPSNPKGRQISIAVAVVPAEMSPALNDPIVVLMGGPGEDAIGAASIYATQFAPLLKDRDLLLVDQRGTGRSNALSCDLFEEGDLETAARDIFPAQGVERCAQRLQLRADLTQYTFAQFANDLEQVRRALGYGRLNVNGGSYGTRATQVFVRAYPESVRTVMLASAVPIDIPPPLTMARSAQAAFEALFVACESDAACRTAFPRFRAEFREVVARLEKREAAPLDRGRVVEWLRAQLYRPKTAASVPWLIHRAYARDYQPISDGVLASARGMRSALSVGVLLSVTCSEDLPFVTDADIERETRGTFLGDYRVKQQRAACDHWPRATMDPAYREPVRSSAPTLFVSGDTDAASPLWFTEHVARGFPNRAEVVLVNRGHTEWSDCMTTVYERFVRAGTARGLDVSLCKPESRPPFKTQKVG